MNGLNVGDLVLFGRPNGEQTRGKIVKVNTKTYKVMTLEGRGRRDQAGQIWNVGKALCRPVGPEKVPAVVTVTTVPTAAPTRKFRFYDRVKFNGMTGIVKRVNRKTLTVVTDSGCAYYVPHAMAELAD